jgi:membrane-associated phospholipid phosphatase
MAITQLAVFEAVNRITGEFEPYLEPAGAAPAGASLDAAVATAAHRVLTNYLPPANDVILDAARDLDLNAIPAGQAKTDGIALGLAAANAMIALADAGSVPLTTFTPSPPFSPGEYQLTTGCTAGAFYNWEDFTPFGIPNAKAYLLSPPPELTGNLFAKAYNESKAVGGADSAERPADRADVARLYAVLSPTTVASMATRQIAVAKGLSSSETARALALITMASSDSLISSFYNKYHYNVARPETGIRHGEGDGNDKTDGDPGFATFIATPCHPSYPSNHATGSTAGLEAIRRLFGAAGHHITISSPVPALGSLPATLITVHYTQLEAIGDDVDDARVYAGIHWRFDQTAGNALGRAIATEVVKNNLRPGHP